MTRENQALLELIRQVKTSSKDTETLTDLECALNVIRSHASNIRKLQDDVRYYRSVIEQIRQTSTISLERSDPCVP